MAAIVQEPRWLQRTASIGLAVLLLVAAAIRLRMLDVPLERDEGEYAYIGALLLDRIPPYTAAYSLKTPGTPAIYALWMAAFGRTIAAIRIGLLLTNSASTVLLFLLAQRRFGSVGAFAAAVTFACLSLATATLGTYAHATHFVVFAAIAGLLALDRALLSARPAGLFAAGTLFGVAVLMKQPGVVFAGFALSWIAWSWWRTQARTWRELGVRILAFLVGFSGPVAVTAAWVWAAGTFDAFWFWTVSYAHHYGTYTPIATGVLRLGSRLGRMAPQLWSFGILVCCGLTVLITRPARERAYVGGLFLFSFAGVCAALQFRPHYFILLAPAAALLVGGLAAEAWTRAMTTMGKRVVLGLVATTIGLSWGQSLWAQREVLFDASPIEVSRALYLASPFPEAVEVARYLKDHSAPTDTIAILGSEPEILFYAERRSATGHLYMYPLMEAHPFARAMQRQMIAEIERAQPRYVVYVRTDGSWNRAVFSDRLVFDWIERFIAARYARVGQVDIRGPRDTRYLWDVDVVGADVTPYTHLLIFRSVDRP
jgi:hypothetical protein